jgi:hypothetical protein
MGKMSGACSKNGEHKKYIQITYKVEAQMKG